MNKRALTAVLLSASITASAAQTSDSSPASKSTAAAKTDAQPAPSAPAPLVVYFDMGSTTIRNEDKAVLDHASRAYSEANPSS